MQKILLKFEIQDEKLIDLALTHSSCTKDDASVPNNERLEFYGDAVLKLVFSKFLFNRFQEDEEGNLTKYRARLISDDLLSKIGYDLEIDNLLKVGSSLKDKKLPKSIIGDAVEALIGAIYIDKGYEYAEKFILENWNDRIEKSLKEALENDFKSILQEKVQMKLKESPEYKTLSSTGPDHVKEFEVGVFVGGDLIASGKGKSKKTAGQDAAKNALEKKQF